MLDLTRDQWLLLKGRWRQFLDFKADHRAWHHLLWLLIRERPVERAFPPVKNKHRIEALERDQRRSPDHAYVEARNALRGQIEQFEFLSKAGRPQDGLRLYPVDIRLPLSAEITAALKARLATLPERLMRVPEATG